MKYIRLRIANYRGIISSEVKFGSRGITLVQGPNEAGKTSLAEAIRLLFTYLDSSKHRDVEAIMPVHRDEGPEIELDAESGPYVFTYSKRFYKKPYTKLTITQPRPENLVGREAHDRAEALLRETLDIDLWKALSIEQGEAIQQPNLAKQTSLSIALDKSAGGRTVDPQNESLFERVRAEYNHYYSDKGTERKDLPEARRLRTETEAAVTEIESQIRGLERDIESAVTLQGELKKLKKQEDDQKTVCDEYAGVLEEIGTLESALSATRLKLESAQKSEQLAFTAKDDRQGLIDAVTETTKAYDKLKESSEISAPALSQAEEQLRIAQEALSTADGASKKADTIATLRRADVDFYNNKLFLEQFRERKGRIDQARNAAAQAQEVLARNKVDTATIETIIDSERALLTANAQLQTGAPSVHIRGLAKCQLQIDETDTILNKGETRDLSVSDRTRLTISRVLEVEIAAGSSTEALTLKVEKTRRQLEAICRKAGVDNPDAARAAFEERREASRQIEYKEVVETADLRDLTYEELVERLNGLEASVPGYLANRVHEPVILSDLSLAKKERASAEKANQNATHEWDAASKAHEAARNVRDQLRATHQTVSVKREMLEKDLKRKQNSLDKARETAPDKSLEANLIQARKTVSTEGESVRVAEESLSAKNPERIRILFDTARGSLETTRKRIGNAQTELTQVQTRLKILGEDGLHEKLRTTQVQLERIDMDNHALFQRGAAAKLLFETMRTERDEARRTYVAPLKQQIERLGRLVFDNDFQVEVSDELQIISRTSNGVTVPFSSLSGGTKEQLSLIFRLACSMIVAKDGGTPLILDDALGYTDPDRLQLMGAVLAKASKECQVVIFTCVPDRYSNIGEATLVSLR